MDRKKLALIHIVKKELNLSDEEYRGTLRSVAGVDSAKDLTDATFRLLLRHFIRSRHYVINRHGLTLRQKLYIGHLQQSLLWTDDHLANFLRKYFKRDGLAMLTRAEASKAIVALRHILAEHGAGTSG